MGHSTLQFFIFLLLLVLLTISWSKGRVEPCLSKDHATGRRQWLLSSSSMWHCISSYIHIVSSHSCCFLLFIEGRQICLLFLPMAVSACPIEDPHTSLCPPLHYSRLLRKGLYCTYSTWREVILLRDDNTSSSAITGHCFEVSEKSYWRASLLPIFSL